MAMTTPIKIVKALDLIAEYYSPRHGRWAYRAFDAINSAFFEGRLPRPLIQWAITSYGACLGLTEIRDRPIITLHPSIMEPSFDPDRIKGPWGFEQPWFGPAFAFDTVLHESIHVAQHAIHRDMPPGETSHNCESWVFEVNRLAPMLGLRGIEAGLNKPKRVPIEDEFTKTGKPATRVARVDEGNVPLAAHSSFPRGVRKFLGTADAYYRAGQLPRGIKLDEESDG
jgi:hypothetical protein